MIGASFEPYVGPWVQGMPVLYNTYTLDQVLQLLNAIKGRFKNISTYGQGAFVWQGKPIIQDSNRLNIQAAAIAGIIVTAGCYQQGANPQGDSINVKWTKTEIDYAIAQVQQYDSVKDLVITNESIWGPNSTKAVVELVNYAKAKRKAAGIPAQLLPITTRQRMDVLSGVNNVKPDYAPTQKAIRELLLACDGYVYADVYPYFDLNCTKKLDPLVDRAVFTAAVDASLHGSWAALQSALSAQKLQVGVLIGESGWPSSGSQMAQPDQVVANVQYAKWYLEALEAWMNAKQVSGYVFEAFDEPWKGPADGSSSEAHFGLWTAQGTAQSPGQYTLTGISAKF